MPNNFQKSRRIVLFVEGDSERGDARRQTLPAFFHKWLDPQLPEGRKVGIVAVKFHGVGNYLGDLRQKVEMYLDNQRANWIVGLLDFYGLPPGRFDLSGCTTVKEKVQSVRQQICKMIPEHYRSRFSQHFAVHELEAWMLAYPTEWPAHIRGQIEKRPPEEVNAGEPPAAFLKRILGGRYKKTVSAKNLLTKVDPALAIEKCPHLRILANDLLKIATSIG